MANVTRLNHAVLYVSDVQRSLDFYQQALGFQVVDRMGDQAVSCELPTRTTTTTSR